MRRTAAFLLLLLLAAASACGPAIQGGQALRSGEYKQAIGFFQQALEESPGDRWTRRQLGKAYLLDGQYIQSAAEFGALLALDPNDWEATYYLALTHIGEGRRDQGFQEIRDMVIPFAYYQKVELVRAANTYAARTDLSAHEIIVAMDQAMDTAKQNQARREAGDKDNR